MVTIEEAIAGLKASHNSPTLLGTPTTLTATPTAGSSIAYTWAFGDDASGSGSLTELCWYVYLPVIVG